MTNVQPYPCNRGTNTPQGWHNFQWSNGQSVCTLCGKVAQNPSNGDSTYYGPYGSGVQPFQ